MRKRVLVVLMVLSMMMLILSGCGANADATTPADTASTSDQAAPADDQSLEVLDQIGDFAASDAEYAPNPEYDKYTLIEYYIEDADATVFVTCSAKADESEYYMEYSFYGDDQEVICDHDGKVSFDKTGFMEGPTPGIVKAIQDQNIWSAIPQ